MLRQVETDRFVHQNRTEFITVSTDRVKGYLSSKWQSRIDDIKADLVMYVAIRPMGYEICIASAQVQAYYDMNRIYGAKGEDFLDLVREHKELIIIQDGHKDIRLTKARELILGFKTMVGVPVMDHHQTMHGILLVMDTRQHQVSQDWIDPIVWLGASIEESIKYLAVEEEIDKIRNVDPLTRLVSRERMMAVLQLEFERSQRSDIPFSLILIDIDHFKAINETFGHNVGDRVLQEFSEEIATRIRMVDTASRWDGDAFAVLCPQTDLLGANALVNDLFSNLTHHIFPTVGRCYFSIGIADYSANDHTLEDLLLRLDKALYRVKAFGGNAVETRYH